jgi:hypothetical protein
VSSTERLCERLTGEPHQLEVLRVVHIEHKPVESRFQVRADLLADGIGSPAVT